MLAPIQIIDDDEDDEFDWEAAVQAIDVACKNSVPSTSSNPPQPPPHSSTVFTEADNFSKEPNKNFRQSTLAKFIGNGVSKPLLEKQSTLDNFISNGGFKSHSDRSSDKGYSTSGGAARDEARIEVEEKGSYVDIDPDAANTWIYPANVPCRDYQLAIAKTALFSNTMVALPTGLGKTLVAAVVMYNYFRWFPEGKIVFAAPSRPLVMQQIEACHNVVGIPQEWTIDMTGQTSPSKRACLWKAKRVFFVTPQVLERDIQSGICLAKFLVCLVIDEAHRALGNYSYAVAVRQLMAVPVQLRILALTATPGSKQQTIQHVIDNLHISTLEYRNESDEDVNPYVHNRKIELMQVPMGQNAVEINNMLLDVIRPIAARLCLMGVLQSKDIQMLSPCDLLNSRDIFRQAPPPALSHLKYGEVEVYFSALITLYHIRKLLSSHGIRPAYEMLEEKLHQGPLARLMSRNEVIMRTKMLMQQSLSHGAPSPKLAKMLEVLVDHFKTNDPESSRVIIFTNFRGSVRDIMDSLANIKDSVKATEFVGQSSGKTLKGQTQKVQQAVLEKFRRGGYNVIVATSIGEEGLDIMEVDLVMCFDANISPLRMIQRMGRTGRKHDGRVVVLACEGIELKGYMRKQATSKAVRKHMRNGGMNSFNFHPSPRMVPHIYKPELQYLELSIKQFVPRGERARDDSTPVIEKLTDAEAASLTKYFQAKENTWKPSLIAFPSFQELPSRVHRVMHSSRTGMLIDTMQILSGHSFSYKFGTCVMEDQDSGSQPVTVGRVEHAEGVKGSVDCMELADAWKEPLDPDIMNEEETYNVPRSPGKTSESGISQLDASICAEKYHKTDCKGLNAVSEPSCTLPGKMMDFPCKSTPLHSFIFGSEIASVDIHGRVSVACIPLLLLSQISFSKSRVPGNGALMSNLNQFPDHSNASLLGNALDRDRCKTKTVEPGSELSSNPKTPTGIDAANADDCTHRIDDNESIFQAPQAEGDTSKRSNCSGTQNVMALKSSMLPAKSTDDVADLDLSPRLTNFIQSGCVPESPLNNPCTGSARVSLPSEGAQTPAIKVPKRIICFSSPPAAQDVHTPLSNMSNISCSKDWQMSTGEKSEAEGTSRQFKRLRRIGESITGRSNKIRKEISTGLCLKLVTKFADPAPDSIKHGKGKKEWFEDARGLIDEEAEVSSEVEVSEDEKDDTDDDSFEDGFIDDRLNPTAAGEPEDGGVDMMAIYRRSLLSQSPIMGQHNFSGRVGSEFGGTATHTTETGSSRKSSGSAFTPLVHPESADVSVEKNSVSSRFNLWRISSDGLPRTSDRIEETTRNIGSQKRKFSNGFIPVPFTNAETEFMSDCATAAGVPCPPDPANRVDTSINDIISDDQLYEELDLDELEAQAANLVKQKADPFTQGGTFSQTIVENVNLFSAPSFDLGIS